MAWRLSSWLGLVRCVQILASFVAASLQGFLLGYMSIHMLGPAQNVPVLQGMMTASLVFSFLALLLIKTGQRSKKTPWLVAAIGGDIVFIGILLAELTILAQAGLPSNCAGFSRWNYLPQDADQEPKEGYTSIRFTNQWNGAKGELDRYCALGRGFYIIAVALVFAYIASIIVEVLLIVGGSYTKNSKMQQQILSAINENERTRSKPISMSSTGDPRNISPTGAPAAHSPANEAPFRQLQQHQNPQPPHAHRQDSRSTHTIPSPLSPHLPAIQHQHHRPHISVVYGDPSPSSSSAVPLQPMRPNNFGYETPEEEVAAAALITDGSRAGPGASGSGLPPRYTPGSLYTPGSFSAMAGHGEEANDMRLSGYVKGETRAQNMKDSFC